MPNGGSDCCGTCWFRQRGSHNAKRETQSHCEIRGLDIPDPLYTYCANHPHHRPRRDPIPIGPVYVMGDADGGREEWQPSPDTEEIREHLLDVLRLPEEHRDKGYHFHTHPAYIAALKQLLEWRDERLVSALEELARHPEMKRGRANIELTVNLARKRFGM